MEMWKMLTQKFKDHSLDEVQPFQAQEIEDRDSGTESDEENAELQAIEEAMQCKRDQENQPVVLSSGLGCGSGYQTPTPSSSSPVSSLSKPRPFQLVSQPSIPFQPLSENTGHRLHHPGHHPGRLGHESPQETSDYERCSLDFEPTSSVEFERPSSEEELAIINCMNREYHHTEKRKRSQMTRCNSCNDSSGSSDDEVRDLVGQPKPLNFSSSPPKGVQRLSQRMSSPKLFLANLSPNVRLCSVSPRKRHRQMSDVTEATVIQRPCLDFEKMQKTLFRKHLPHGIAKARILKIRLGLLKGTM